MEEAYVMLPGLRVGVRIWLVWPPPILLPSMPNMPPYLEMPPLLEHPFPHFVWPDAIFIPPTSIGTGASLGNPAWTQFRQTSLTNVFEVKGAGASSNTGLD